VHPAILFLFFPLNSDRCNSFNRLGHFKRVYDDDDDDDFDTILANKMNRQTEGNRAIASTE